MWAVKELIVPIFGHTIINSDNKEVDVKDMCERDHLLVDFGSKFIPTLSDFVNAIDIDTSKEIEQNIERLHQTLKYDSEVSNLLLSPLAVTGKLKSLLVTHNSWFVNQILPKIFNVNPAFRNFEISPQHLFQSMNFEAWMDNGLCIAPSAQKLNQLKIA